MYLFLQTIGESMCVNRARCWKLVGGHPWGGTLHEEFHAWQKGHTDNDKEVQVQRNTSNGL